MNFVGGAGETSTALTVHEIPKVERIRKENSFLLSHSGLSNYPNRYYFPNGGYGNRLYFNADLVEGRLTPFRGRFVAYQHGTLAGAHDNMEELYNQTTAYYGQSSLGVFEVPKGSESLHSLKFMGTV